jgi:16S rRNA (cytosine967-C5)-methyltransferase
VRRGNPLASSAFARGAFYLQDEASQAAALLPPPRPGERILDAAAAPGGKSFALLASEPDIEIFAGDVSFGRSSILRANLRRLRLPLPMLVADAAEPPFTQAFDRVVLDLPCTGTGTLRRHPEIKWRISESEIGRLSRQALRMLEATSALVREGGLLAAITCSLEREENEEVVTRFLQAHPEFAPLPLEEHLSHELAEHVTGPGGWRILAAGDHDGFSVNVLRKAPS